MSGNTIMASSRQEFRQRTRQLLAERVGHRCSNPRCQRPTIGPHSDPDKSLSIGRACHIRAAAPGGPRFDPRQTEAERTSPANGIWLCAGCSDLVDKDVSGHPEQLLYEWKTDAERVIADQLTQSFSAAAPAETSRRSLLEANQYLDKAADALAGEEGACRITWTRISPQDLEITRRALTAARSLAPNSQRLHLLQAVYYAAKGFPDLALSALDGVGNEHEAEADLLRARCYFEGGRLDDSIAILRRLAESPSAPAAVHYNLAKTLDAIDSTQAEECLRKAIAIDPNYYQAYDELARCAFERKELVEATRLAARANALQPDDGICAEHYALCLLEQDRVESAIEVIRHALSSNPGSAGLLQILGRAYAQLGDFVHGEEYIRRALDIDVDHDVAQHNLGMVFLYTRRWEDAQVAFERAAALGYPEEPDIAGRIEKARRLAR